VSEYTQVKDAQPTAYLMQLQELPIPDSVTRVSNICVSCGSKNFVPSYSQVIDGVLLNLCETCDKMWDLHREPKFKHYKRSFSDKKRRV